MEKKNLTIKLLNRSFQVMINPNEEATLIRASKLVEDKLHLFKSRYNINEEIYLVLMCCLDIAHENVRTADEHHAFRSYYTDRMLLLNEMLERAALIPPAEITFSEPITEEPPHTTNL